MAERGLDIQKDPRLDARATDTIAAVLADKKQLVPSSQTLAQLLYDAQDRRNPEGILDRTEAELDRTEAELDRTEAELDRLRLRLAVSDRTARARTRITRALRRELTATRRALRRARTP
jgi:hypothetical protein